MRIARAAIRTDGRACWSLFDDRVAFLTWSEVRILESLEFHHLVPLLDLTPSQGVSLSYRSWDFSVSGPLGPLTGLCLAVLPGTNLFGLLLTNHLERLRLDFLNYGRRFLWGVGPVCIPAGEDRSHRSL